MPEQCGTVRISRHRIIRKQKKTAASVTSQQNPAMNDQEELPDCFFVHALRRGIFTLKKQSFHASIFNNMGRVESYIFCSDSANC